MIWRLDVGKGAFERGLKFQCPVYTLQEGPIDVDSVSKDIKPTAASFHVSPTYNTDIIHIPVKCIM